MKTFLVRISLGIVGLSALVYFLACSPSPQNNNSNQNQALSPNQNQANAKVSSRDLKPCEYGAPPGAHAQQIKKDIEAEMDSSLKKLLKDQANPNGTFTIEVQKAATGNYFVAYVRGKVSGDDNLKKLSNILNNFQNKEACLRVVYFLPTQKLTADDRDDGFEWSSCEHPMVICPNGECCIPMQTNTNTPVNVNTNVNTNTNANGNR